MKKLINLFMCLAMCLVATGCTVAEKTSVLESGYKLTKKGVQTFVSDKKREKFHTKDLDKIVSGTYSIIKDAKSKNE